MKKSLLIGLTICMIIFILGGMPNEVSAKQDQLIIINKSDNMLHFYDNGKKVKSFRVATGKRSNLTPEGTFSVKLKWSCPVYYATNKKGCTSSNPLGPRWIGLSVPGTKGYTYGIHGTNQESSIGSYASSGCVRMLNKEVTWLFDQVKVGAKVVIIRSTKSADTIAIQKGYSLTNATESPSKDTVTNKITYKAQKGETLWKISQKFKVSVTDLKKWNHLSNNNIKVGQTLIVSSTNTNTETKIEPVNGTKKLVKVSSYLNVRSKPNTSASVIGKLKNGQVVEVLSAKNKWATIKINGKTGYVNTDYLKNPS